MASTTSASQALLASRTDYCRYEFPKMVSAGDFDGDGLLDLVIADGEVSILHNMGNGIFTPDPGYPLSPLIIHATDVTADGITDVLAVRSQIITLKNTGTGIFEEAVGDSVPISSRVMAMGDFDGDGFVDAVIPGRYTDSVHLFFNDGNGVFREKAQLAVGNTPVDVLTGDINGDGASDIAVVNQDENSVTVLINSGTGLFAPGVDYSAGNQPKAITGGDLDGDGDFDLAVVNSGPNPESELTIAFLFNNGEGVFQADVAFAGGILGNDIEAVDIDGDLDIDLVYARYKYSGTALGVLTVIENTGDGVFQVVKDYPGGHGLYRICSADLDNDGFMDVASVATSDATVGVFINRGDGAFPPTTYEVGINSDAVCLGDFDGDGYLDMAAAQTGYSGIQGTGLSVFHNLQNGDMEFAAEYAVGSGPWGLCSEDFDGDGSDDLASVNLFDNTLSVLLNTGGGEFDPSVTYGVGEGPASICAIDLNGDSDPDLATADQSGSITVLLNDGTGVFSDIQIYSAGDNNLISICAADFDYDGHNDLAAACFNMVEGSPLTGVLIYYNHGNGIFAEPESYDAGQGCSAAAAADFDDDGFAELLIAGFYRIGYFDIAGAGNASYSLIEDFPDEVTGYCDVEITDIDRDGDEDIIVSKYSQTSRILIYFNDGLGNFSRTETSYGAGLWPRTVVAGDLDGDGDAEVITSNEISSDISILVNLTYPSSCGDTNGDGVVNIADVVYIVNYIFRSGPAPIPLEAVDVNGDGLTNIGDAVYLIGYLFHSGSPPEC